MLLLFHSGRFAELDASLTKPQVGERIGGLLAGFVQILRIRMALLRGCHEAASGLIQDSNLEVRWGAADYSDQFAYQEWDLLGLCLAEVRIHRGDCAGAVAILDRVEEVARVSGRMRTLVSATALRSAVHHRLGDTEAALAHLGHALEAGLTHGFRRTFLDLASHIQPVLDAFCVRGASQSHSEIVTYAQSLLRVLARDPRKDHKAANVLSGREQDVLRELGLGHPNKLIARKLGLSEATIKFHMKNIFRKLKVRRRAAVVSEAHRQGLMS
jgi:LuxR family transcriptional regulator, maltose regulon positive regulatory protein